VEATLEVVDVDGITEDNRWRLSSEIKYKFSQISLCQQNISSLTNKQLKEAKNYHSSLVRVLRLQKIQSLQNHEKEIQMRY
jgi:hypothetical protein